MHHTDGHPLMPHCSQALSDLMSPNALYYDEDGYIRCSTAKFVNYLPSVGETVTLMEAQRAQKAQRKRDNAARIARTIRLLSAVKTFSRFGERRAWPCCSIGIRVYWFTCLLCSSGRGCRHLTCA